MVPRLFETICDETNMGLMLLHPHDLKCTYLNTMAREILALDATKKCEDCNTELLIPEMNIDGYRSFSKFLFSVPGFSDDVFMNRFDGSTLIVNLAIKILPNEKDEFLLLMFRDVTAEKKLHREVLTKQEELNETYEALLRQNQELAQLDKTKDKFIALTTHELRTPASAILATADLLYQGMYDTPEELNDYIHTMLHQSEHLLHIVNDILDFSKIQAGKMDFYIEQKDINENIERTVESLLQLSASDHLQMKFERTQLPLLCYFDGLRINQVLANIIGNAIKFNRAGGQITITTEVTRGFVRVAVTDQGEGIPKDKYDKVFNEFETVGNIDTHHKGTGLGMPISKRLIKTMGGEIGFYSEVGIGTTFYIDIPTTRTLKDEVYRERPKAA